MTRPRDHAFPRPAFVPATAKLEPRERGEYCDPGAHGITYREYLAGRAMQALATGVCFRETTEAVHDMATQIAEAAVKLADALIEELDK